ncbi:MAG: sugar phosphate nucleotidyltransferase [Candidatus Cloacimonetes bacterium]|nr:sugar phosphate nucleotidyltransferase [Candidatus Cloacimonadota bacterium]
MSKIGVIILAAGKGTRMKSEKPKVCFELGGKSLIQRVVNTGLQLKADMIAIVVGYKKDLVEKAIENHPAIRFVTQENQNGTGDAVKSASSVFTDFSGTVFVLCGDVPLLKPDTLQKMYKKHRETEAKCTVLTMILENPDRYGRIVRDSQNRVQEIVEYKDACQTVRGIKEINTGIYCFDSETLFLALDKITNNNAQNEYYLTDVLKIMYHQNYLIESVVLEDISEAAGINSQQQLADLETQHYKAIKTHWMDNGVSIENPDTVLIEEDVTIEPDVYISANVKIKGKSFIGKDSFIGTHSFIENSTLQTGSFLAGMNVIIDSCNCFDLQWFEKYIENSLDKNKGK